MKFLIPWILTAIRGAFTYAIAISVLNMTIGEDTISWHLLWFGVPSAVIADFAGFFNVLGAPAEKPNVLGMCYFALVALAVACGFVVGLWEGLLVFGEGWIFGVPGGHRRAIASLDSIGLARDRQGWRDDQTRDY